MVRKAHVQQLRAEILGELDRLRSRVSRLEQDDVIKWNEQAVRDVEFESRIDTLFKRANDLGSKVIRVEGMLDTVIRIAGARCGKKKLNSKK